MYHPSLVDLSTLFSSLFTAKNVLLCEEYTCAKLADFDSAKTLPDEFTESGLRPLGTPGFASPEVGIILVCLFFTPKNVSICSSAALLLGLQRYTGVSVHRDIFCHNTNIVY